MNFRQTFFEALAKRELTTCQQVLADMQAVAQTQPALKQETDYWRGIMRFELEQDWAAAETIFRQLLQAPLEERLQLPVQYALGRTFDNQGRWDEAITTFEQVLNQATGQADTAYQAKAMKHLAITYRKGFSRGAFTAQVLPQAISYCQQALILLADSSDDDLKGSLLNTLGLAYMYSGDYDMAISCHKENMVIRVANDDHHNTGLIYGNLGEAYQKQGDFAAALTAYQTALHLIQQYDNRYEAIDALANLAYLHQERGTHETAFEYYRQSIDLIEAARADVSSAEARAGFFGTTIDIYANMVLLCVTRHQPEQAWQYIERARSRAFLDLMELRETVEIRRLSLPKSGSTGSTSVTPDLMAPRADEMGHALALSQAASRTTSLTDLQAKLPPDTLLLEYFTTGLVEVRESRREMRQLPPRHRFPVAKTLLVAITHDDLQIYDTGISPNDLRPNRLDNVVSQHFLAPQIRRTLYDKLIGPITSLLPGKRQLYIIPHGPLHYLPFQALIAPDGHPLLRDDGPTLRYAPSATLLFQPSRSHAVAPAESCLSLGYNSRQNSQLHFAEQEAHRVADQMGGQAITGPQPKKATLFQQGPRYRLLHLACHAEFDSHAPRESFLAIAATERLTVAEILSGLQLRCDLVTLSACETGLSRVRRGDELIGLSQAFMQAGAAMVLATLWKVDDRATQILMERFYERVKNGLSFDEALKQAQLSLRQYTLDGDCPYADPDYWAAFILMTVH